MTYITKLLLYLITQSFSARMQSLCLPKASVYPLTSRFNLLYGVQGMLYTFTNCPTDNLHFLMYNTHEENKTCSSESILINLLYIFRLLLLKLDTFA